MLTHHQFMDVLGLGAAYALDRFVAQVRVAACASPELEKTEAMLALGLLDTLSTYRHTFAFTFPMSTMDAFVAQYIGKVADDRKVYYAVLSLLWRADLTLVKTALQKRIESLK